MRKPPVWFHSLGLESASEAPIREHLAAAQIQLRELDSENTEPYGIICFAQIDDILLRFLHGFRRDTSSHVIALDAHHSKVESGLKWRLIHAGASEVLEWNGALSVDHIVARLQRLFAVDDLANAVSARESIIGES